MTGEKQFGAALYELAHEEKKEDTVLFGITEVQNAFAQNEGYLKLLSNPAVPKAERLALIEEAFGTSLERYAVSFVKILCERGALSALPTCVKEYTALLHEQRGIMPVVAECAVALTPEQEKRLCEKLNATTGKTVELTCKVNPLLIGGVRLSYKGKQLDGTIAQRFNALKAALLS